MPNKLTFTPEGECCSVDELGTHAIPNKAKSELPLRFTLIDGKVVERYKAFEDEAAILEHARLQNEERAALELDLAQSFHISANQFKVWLGPKRRMAIRALAKTDPTVEDFQDSLTFVEYVDSKDPNLIGALDYLEAKGGESFSGVKADFYLTAVERKIQ